MVSRWGLEGLSDLYVHDREERTALRKGYSLWLAKILIYFRNSNLRRTFQISFSVKLRHVPPAAAPFRVTHSPVLFPPRTPPGESGSAPTTRRAQVAQSATEAVRARQTLLGLGPAMLGGMEEGPDCRHAGHRGSLAPRWLSTLFGRGCRGIESGWAGSRRAKS